MAWHSRVTGRLLQRPGGLAIADRGQDGIGRGRLPSPGGLGVIKSAIVDKLYAGLEALGQSLDARSARAVREGRLPPLPGGSLELGHAMARPALRACAAASGVTCSSACASQPRAHLRVNLSVASRGQILRPPTPSRSFDSLADGGSGGAERNPYSDVAHLVLPEGIPTPEEVLQTHKGKGPEALQVFDFATLGPPSPSVAKGQSSFRSQIDRLNLFRRARTRRRCSVRRAARERRPR